MYLVRVGTKRLNLHCLVMTDAIHPGSDAERGPGVLVAMQQGHVFELWGDEARELMRHLDANLATPPDQTGPVHSVRIDPATNRPCAAPVREGEQPG